MSKKNKLLVKLKEKPKDFTWSEALTLMRQHGFDLHKGSGSARMFVHTKTRIKVRLHEPHPQNTLLPYMVEQLIEGLENAGEVTK